MAEAVKSIEFTAVPTADAASPGMQRLQNVNGTMSLVDQNAATLAIGGGGIGWVGETAVPFAAQQFKGANLRIKSFEYADFLRGSEASTGATFQANQTGGVYRFAAAVTQWSFVGSQMMLASATSVAWCFQTLVTLIGTPGAGDISCYCAMNDGADTNRICFELNGPGSTTIGQLRFDKASSITRSPLNAFGTIGVGTNNIIIGTPTTFALVYLPTTNVVSAYVNGNFAGSRNDISTVGPTTSMTPWVQQPAFATGTFDLDKAAFFISGP